MANIQILALDAARTGGAGVYTSKLIHALHNRGHNITLICHEAEDSVKKVAKVFEIPRPFTHFRLGMWRLSALIQIKHYRKYLKSLNLSEQSIVFASAQPMTWPYHTLYPNRALIYIPHSLVAPVELKSYEYGDKLQRVIAVATYEYLEKKCLKHAKTTIRFTETACLALRNYYGRSIAKNFSVLPMPIEVGPPNERNRQNQAIRLLSVGRLIKTKNLQFLLDLLSKKVDLDWHLDIVGTGDEKESLERFVLLNRLTEHITFHGHCDDVKPFYRSSDMFVFPSLLESFGLVLIEAMSQSLPSLSFRPDGVRFLTASDEFIVHNVSGLLAKDENDFEILLNAVLTRQIDLPVMGAAGRANIKLNHQWDSHIEKIEELVNIYGIPST